MQSPTHMHVIAESISKMSGVCICLLGVDFSGARSQSSLPVGDLPCQCFERFEYNNRLV